MNLSIKNIDELKWFCTSQELKDFVNKYNSGQEKSIIKQVPLNQYNISMIKKLSNIFSIQKRYRGPRLRGGFMRECHKRDAERVSVYIR